jgi:hypothetical protein
VHLAFECGLHVAGSLGLACCCSKNIRLRPTLCLSFGGWHKEGGISCLACGNCIAVPALQHAIPGGPRPAASPETFLHSWPKSALEAPAVPSAAAYSIFLGVTLPLVVFALAYSCTLVFIEHRYKYTVQRDHALTTAPVHPVKVWLFRIYR